VTASIVSFPDHDPDDPDEVGLTRSGIARAFAGAHRAESDLNPGRHRAASPVPAEYAAAAERARRGYLGTEARAALGLLVDVLALHHDALLPVPLAVATSRLVDVLAAPAAADPGTETADGAPVVDVLTQAARQGAAEELRRLVVELDPSQEGERRLVADRLLARAAELDPDGAR
jgi:hypothetical protein